MKKGKYKHSEQKLREMEKTKEDIIRSAFSVFRKHGFENSSISEIARKAGVAKGTVYTYFESKTKLYAEIMILIINEFEVTLQKEILKNDTGLVKVTKIGRCLYDFFRKNYFYYQVFSFMNSNLKEIVKGDMRLQRDPIAELTIKYIETGKSDGSISKKVHPVKFLAFASSTIWGMLMFMHERGDDVMEGTGLSEQEMIDYNFLAMQNMLTIK